MRKFVLAAALMMTLSVGLWPCLAADKAAPAADAAKPPAKPAKPVVVLDTYGVWRTHQTLKPAVLAMGSGLTPVLTPQDWMNRETPEPSAGWTGPDFDDTTWLRGSARAHGKTPYLSRLCLRARFEVTDPSQVGRLHLNLAYYGGVVITVNGQEVARGHLAAKGPAQLAEGYPPEAFLTEDGKIVPSGWVAARHKKAVAARERKLNDVEIPAKLLRKGVNVVAIELVRAPYHKVVDEKKLGEKDKKTLDRQRCPYHLSWNTCEMRGVRLIAAGDVGLVPNAARPKELQVWNSDFLSLDYGADLADRCEPLRPVAIKGVRNGWFSGKVVLGSAEPIEALKATCTDLTKGAATIPTSAVRIRYGSSWGGHIARYGEATRYNAPVLDALLETPLDIFPVGRYGAVVPVWVTVKVPADAAPGTYTGQLTITVKGGQPVNVPVTLDVADWTLPDNQDWRTWIELVQSPDTLVAEYEVPFWSDRHWEMIARSMRYMGEAGNRVVYVPLICHTNYGNEQSMVRWIKKADGTCEYDFSIMDKYLDLAEKNMGKPRFVVFTAWEIYLATPKSEVIIKDSDSSYVKMEKSWAAARWSLRGKGPAVTALDPGTGQIETVYLPRFDDPAAKPLWKPLFDALHQRMKRRGLEDTMMLGMASDAWPTKDELTTLQDASGNLPWIMHTHGGSRVGKKMHGIAPVGYIAYVWNVDYAPDPSEGRLYGWKQPELMAQFRRFKALNEMSPSALLHFQELNITGRQRGMGRIGADFWGPYKDKKGRRTGWVWQRYPQSLWHSLNLSSHMLVPGPAGPVASSRLEFFREGMQQCEARIAIERALTDDALKARLGPQLAKRCQDVLDERLREVWRSGSGMNLTGRHYASAELAGDYFGGIAGHCWFVGSGWQDRTQKFYALAGEVARKLAAN